MSRIFISHAAADAPLALRLVDLLQKGCSLRGGEIFCTSAEGSNLTTGGLFTAEIQDALREASLVVLLVTPMWWSKAFCVAEAGGAWALDKRVFPLIVPGLSRDMGAQMLGTQTRALDKNGLADLRDAVTEAIPAAKTTTPKWTMELDLFLDGLDALLAGLAHPDTVTRAEFDAAVAERQAAMDAVREAREEIANLVKLNEALRAAKDRDEVRAVDLQHSGVEDTFEMLRVNVRDALRDLSQAEEEVLFATTAGRAWIPSGDLQTFRPEMIRDLRDGGRAVDEGGGWEADRSDPVMDRAARAVDEFAAFLNQNEAQLEPLIQEKYGVKAALDNKRLWQTAFGATFT